MPDVNAGGLVSTALSEAPPGVSDAALAYVALATVLTATAAAATSPEPPPPKAFRR